MVSYLRENHELQMCGRKALSKKSGLKNVEVSEQFRVLHD
jgi:hypothetical protein